MKHTGLSDHVTVIPGRATEFLKSLGANPIQLHVDLSNYA